MYDNKDGTCNSQGKRTSVKNQHIEKYNFYSGIDKIQINFFADT